MNSFFFFLSELIVNRILIVSIVVNKISSSILKNEGGSDSKSEPSSGMQSTFSQTLTKLEITWTLSAG